MNDAPALADLLASPDARFLAFDPTGVRTVRIPESIPIDADRVVDVSAPLESIDQSGQAGAVVAFEHARRVGYGAARVSLVDDPGNWWLDIFDMTSEHGCFLAAFSPIDPTAPLERPTSEHTPRQATFTMDASGVVLSVSPEFTRLLGWTEDELVGETSLILVHPDDQEAGIVAWAEMLSSPGPTPTSRQRLSLKSGGWLWVESTEWNHLDDADDPHVLSESIDISREVRAEAELQRRETVLDRLYRSLPTGVVVLEPDGTVAARNDRWTEFVGESEQGPLDALLARVDDRRAVLAAITAAVRDDADVDLELDLDATTSCRHADLHVRPLVEGGQHVGLLLTLDDSTEWTRQERALAEQSRHDPLTGAVNRLGADELLTGRLERAAAGEVDFGLLYLDLDDFKLVNDTRGHAAGDRLLCSVVDAIRDRLDDVDVVARIGGDEFLVVLGEPLERLADLAEQIRSEVAALGERIGVPVGASIGSTRVEDGDDIDRLIGRADAAMYADKAARRRAVGRDRRQRRTSD